MALINCPDCEAPVSSKAEKCLRCGHPIRDKQARQGSGSIKPRSSQVDPSYADDNSVSSYGEDPYAYIENGYLVAPGLKIPADEVRRVTFDNTNGGKWAKGLGWFLLIITFMAASNFFTGVEESPDASFFLSTLAFLGLGSFLVWRSHVGYQVMKVETSHKSFDIIAKKQQIDDIQSRLGLGKSG